MVEPGGSIVKIDPVRQHMTAEVAPQSHPAAPEEHVRGIVGIHVCVPLVIDRQHSGKENMVCCILMRKAPAIQMHSNEDSRTCQAHERFASSLSMSSR